MMLGSACKAYRAQRPIPQSAVVRVAATMRDKNGAARRPCNFMLRVTRSSPADGLPTSSLFRLRTTPQLSGLDGNFAESGFQNTSDITWLGRCRRWLPLLCGVTLFFSCEYLIGISKEFMVSIFKRWNIILVVFLSPYDLQDAKASFMRLVQF